MDKPLEVSDMPPLTELEHAQLRAMERELRIHLGSCTKSSGYSIADPEAAFEYLRTYAVKFFDFFYAYYSVYPDDSYRPHWRPAAEKFAYQRVIKCVENLSSYDFFLSREDRSARLKRTISESADIWEKGEDSASAESSPASAIAEELKALKAEARLSAQKIADGIEVDLRTVQRHLAGNAVPRAAQIGAYETFFSKVLRREVKIEMP